MSATDITFARKTATIDGFLTRYWHWGERGRLIPADPVDEQYGACYPNQAPPPFRQDCADQNGIAAEMIDRRREKLVLDALEDLVGYLHNVREERKAILAISDGWLLYRPNDHLARPLRCHGVPTGPTISVDPRSGRLTTKEPENAARRSRNATPIGCSSRSSTTIDSSATCSTRRTAPMLRSIRSIREGWRRSTRR